MIDYCGQLIAQALAKRSGCLQKDVFAIKGLNHHLSLDGSFLNQHLFKSGYLTRKNNGTPESGLAKHASECEVNINTGIRS